MQGAGAGLYAHYAAHQLPRYGKIPGHVWLGLHTSARFAPLACVKLYMCTYFCWFAQPDRMLVEPGYELPMPITKLRSLLDGFTFVAD